MKKVVLLALALCAALPLLADEGMWLPNLIARRIDDMGAKGCRLSAEDIYSINKASLKDAVVLFGSGCTGELVSPQGLLFTNHHCGYGYIQRHSSVEHDYLKDGFWAMSREEELPNPGLTVSFLERMEDVTDVVLYGWEPSMGEVARDSVARANSQRLEKEIAEPSKGIRASVEALYHANQYYLFVYRIYRDVRLVGAPPSSIGKFGGDTDNWMWPRHTGDFSIFRIYADADGNPADYSPDNVPYRPKKFFSIAKDGVKEGDFTFVYGCPGSTREYVHSEEVRYIGEVSDPQKIALRTLRLDIQKKYMSQSQAVRIQYSAKNASVANAWKKWQGESRGVQRLGTVEAKRAYEKRLSAWAAGGPYDGLVERLGALYQKREPYYLAYEYFNETVRSIELLSLAWRVYGLLERGIDDGLAVRSFFKDYYEPIDKETFVALLEAFRTKMPQQFQPEYFKEQVAAAGSVQALADDIYSRSMFTSCEVAASLGVEDMPKVVADPAYQLYAAFFDWLQEDIMPVLREVEGELRTANRLYMKAQMEFEPEREFYPDANLTLRVAYGNVAGYSPADAVYYTPVSTLKGIIEKDNPDIFDYNIPQTLRDIYAAGGHEDQPVCFLATNHTTGGNSGSPVLNADGLLVGINFDRVWEGTMSDLQFDPCYCRNISLDVRYLLFIIKQIGHAEWLFSEMVIK
jgi:hypothetical protein